MTRVAILALAAGHSLALMSPVPATAQGLLGEGSPSDVVTGTRLTVVQDNFITSLREIDIERFMRARGVITERGPGGAAYKPVGDWTQSDYALFIRRYGLALPNGGAASSQSLEALAMRAFWELQSLNGGGEGDGDGGGD